MKTITTTVILILLLIIGITQPLISISHQEETRTIKIIDAKTGSNSITLGTNETIVPPGGHPFTVNITLEGATDKLFVYQVAVKFDRTKIRCTAAWINRNDPNFVFYNYRSIAVIPNAEINNNEGYVFLGASLINGYYVNISSGLLCQISFTAIKTGKHTLEILPSGGSPESFLAYTQQGNLRDIPFNTEKFFITVIAAPTPPVASFTFNPPYPKANQDITFDAEESYDPDGEIKHYVWNFADGNPDVTTNESIISHSFSKNGVYLVNLTVYDDSGFSNSIYKEIQVGQIPMIRFGYEPELIMPNQTVTFDASESYDPDGDINLYVWDFGDGNTTSTNGKRITHKFTKKGVFRINLTIYDNEGLHNSTSREIFVGKPPIAEFVYSLTITNGKYVVNFDASKSLAGENNDYIVRYIWDFGDYNITETTSQTIQHVYLEVGEYPVKLIVYDNNGLYNSITKIIKIQKTAEFDTKILIAAGITVLVITITATILKKRRKTSFPKKGRPH